MAASSVPKPDSPPRWFRITNRLAAIAVLLALPGATYQTFSERTDMRRYPTPGNFVDINGLYDLHIYCSGSGSPAVILDSGLGDTYVVWRKVQPRMAQFARVCSYDRAGLGFSCCRRRPPTSRNNAEDLHTLLHNAGVAPPYVLVGHSMGGFDVRIFAGLYRSEVAGMVLVDSSHPEQIKRFPPAVNDLDASWIREQEFLAVIMPFGIPRLLGFCGGDAQIRAAECNFHTEWTGVDEMKLTPVSAAQTAATGSLGDLPLAVLSQDPDSPHPDLPEDLVKPTVDAWSKMQDELAQLSTRSTHVIAKNSGHYIQLDRPDLVVEAVHQIMQQARQTSETEKAP